MFWMDIARFLQYVRNFFNSFINIIAILQDFNGIFSKYSLNITVLCGLNRKSRTNGRIARIMKKPTKVDTHLSVAHS